MSSGAGARAGVTSLEQESKKRLRSTLLFSHVKCYILMIKCFLASRTQYIATLLLVVVVFACRDHGSWSHTVALSMYQIKSFELC